MSLSSLADFMTHHYPIIASYQLMVLKGKFHLGPILSSYISVFLYYFAIKTIYYIQDTHDHNYNTIIIIDKLIILSYFYITHYYHTFYYWYYSQTTIITLLVLLSITVVLTVENFSLQIGKKVKLWN